MVDGEVVENISGGGSGGFSLFLCQSTTVRWLKTSAAAASAVVVAVVVAVAAVVMAGVDIEDGIQWRRWGGGHSMGVAAFDSGGDGLRIGDVKEKMVIDTTSGGWRRRASEFNGGNGRR